ncbi:protein-methionine-sulfoxide reductase heme-binding subunit MsrQ [Arenimonas maotaiensis]|uniref:Protein-methionine-sulfoxide reductase heme-binding subunit MsrQ n=2 Tax=Arenimonas maotaiensis TaxID=1446479 RepID=A0A917CP40_9GAMM|nr:protein-methionine-sulfoxide reductase heme-binding subunit MsrQ [Arenimonas maotaiensis]
MVLSRIDWRWFGLKALAHAMALTPAALLFWRAWHDGLGADPVAALTHGTGDWALRLLLLGLAMTPLRQIGGRSWPIRFRRLIGLYAFFYASLHLAVYLLLDLGSYWSQIGADILKRPFITVGFAAWLLLLPLALTSTQAMMRRLKKNWQRLHRLVYAIAVLAVLHFWWLVKSDIREPLLYAAILAALLGWRVFYRRQTAGSAVAKTEP